MQPIIPDIDIDVKLTNRVIEYIKENGGVITIEEAPQTGCCTNYIFVGAHLGKPSEGGYYKVTSQDGILIYSDPFILKKNKTYEVDLEGFLKWKTIVVS